MPLTWNAVTFLRLPGWPLPFFLQGFLLQLTASTFRLKANQAQALSFWMPRNEITVLTLPGDVGCGGGSLLSAVMLSVWHEDALLLHHRARVVANVSDWGDKLQGKEGSWLQPRARFGGEESSKAVFPSYFFSVFAAALLVWSQ